MSEESPFIEIRDLSFQYNDRKVLEQINLSLKRGGFYMFMGPNGGGKTTLLKLIMGILKPNSGTITIDGQLPKEQKTRIGYAPQTLRYDPLFPLSVTEFVLMGALSKLTWYGAWPKEVRKRAHEIIDFVEMTKHKEASIGTLSGGQLQRVSLARALINQPDILILDEPTTGLDPDASHLIQKKICEFKGEMTVLFVTHTTPDMIKEFDELICINGSMEILKPEHVCNHHTYGLFHPKDKQQGDV